jgi:hypothetical protein
MSDETTADTTADQSDEQVAMVQAYRNEFQGAADRAGPQPGYLAMLEETGGISCPFPGFVQASSREAVTTVLGDRKNFSSAGTMELGNVRPMIPLQVDPPAHANYRKILDPLFAPKVMDAAEADLTARVNHFIDEFADRGWCNFTDEFAELFPSAVFLGLMGLPWEELDTFLRLRDGILRVMGPDIPPLVTGAAGFIGMHTTLRLLAKGESVVGIDNLNDYYDDTLKEARLARLKHPQFEFVRMDISDLPAVESLFAQKRFGTVINLAAQAGVRYSLKNPHAYVSTNVQGFLNILEACRHNGVEHLVYASSSSVYGGNTDMPFSEHTPVDHPVSLYGAT